MDAESPVIPGSYHPEVIFRANPGEDVTPPMPALRREADIYGRVLSRWVPTEEERRAIADGADVYVMVYTFNSLLQPYVVGTEVPPDFQHALPPPPLPPGQGAPPPRHVAENPAPPATDHEWPDVIGEAGEAE